MRPVERGPVPQTYSKYQDAMRDLEARLGTYCSYCERRMPTGLAVEHVLPKGIHPDLETEWTNFLLACVNCNSVKGSTDISREDYIWPDYDNTYLAFAYTQGGFVYLADDMNTEQRSKAQALLDLAGLQRHQADNWPVPSERDNRWRQRDEVWAAAARAKELFQFLAERNVDYIDQAIEQVLEVARYSGFFSVWMTVFEDYPNIRTGLIQLFSGTAPSCFTPDGKPINRPGRII